MSVARGELILTLVPPPIQDNDLQRETRNALAIALVNYHRVFFHSSRTLITSLDELTHQDAARAIHWAYEAEYAAFLRPRVQQDVAGNQVNGD